MRKVIMFNLITLDGYFEGPNKDISWHQVDDEFNQFAIEQLNSTDGLIFGRLTYELMKAYWPTPTAVENDPIVAGKMNSLPKFVFSKSLTKVDWNNTQLVKGEAVRELKRLKQQSGRDLFIFGSAVLSSTFTRNRLIDEYRILVNPILLGDGVRLFKGEYGLLKMKLLNTKAFQNGNILLSYQLDQTVNS
jgi:dihydrofolate reductase